MSGQKNQPSVQGDDTSRGTDPRLERARAALLTIRDYLGIRKDFTPLGAALDLCEVIEEGLRD